MSPDKLSPNAPIAIVGIGARFPDAPDADTFWNNIEAGKTAFSDIPKERWNHDIFYSENGRDTDKAWTNKGSFIQGYQDFAPMHFGIAPRRLEVMDPQQRLLIETTRVAIQDAGYEQTDFPRDRTGVYVGLSIAEFQQLTNARLFAMRVAAGDFGGVPGTEALRQALIDLTANVVPIRAFTLSGSLTALASASIAQTFDLGGPAYTMDSACASASVAVHDAVTNLRTGAIDAAVAGGAYLNLAPDNLVAFTKIGAISARGVCRPFDHRSDGFLQSDGVAMLFLKRLDDALLSGDRIYATIRASGVNNDGRGEGPMTPRKKGQRAVLKATYEQAGFSPSTVSYFEAHGTATSIGDPVEVAALGETLNEAGVALDAQVPVGSVKGNIGHAMSAAGIAGLVKAIKVLQRRIVPPQPGFEKANPRLNLEQYPLTVPTEATELRPRGEHPLRVAVSSFGFGGTNSHIVLEEPPTVVRHQRVSRPMSLQIDEVSSSQETLPPEAVLVTAPTPQLLRGHLEELKTSIVSGPAREASLADLAFTLNARRRHERYRAVIAARSPTELVENLQATADTLDEAGSDPQFPLQVNRHCVIHEAPQSDAPKVAFLFAGQGAQKVGLLSDIKERFSTFEEAFENYARAADRGLTRPLRTYLYPQGLDSKEAETAAEEVLKATEVCQPAMAALGLATSKFLQDLGIKPSVSLGHSLGEFTALACAGVLSPQDAVRLVTARGAAMRALPLEDTGTMAAVTSDESTVQAAISEIDGVWVANVNQPQQVSISGSTPAVAEATVKLQSMGLQVRALSVSHAFHSPLVEGVSKAIEDLLQSMTLNPPQHVAASCIASSPHGEDADLVRKTLLKHATAPVLFSRGLEQVSEAGATVFVQVGAGNILTNFAKATLGRSGLSFVNLASLEPDGGFEMLKGLCTLAALGVPVQMHKAYDGEDRQVVTLPETPLERQAYWPLKTTEQPQVQLTLPIEGEDSSRRRVFVEGETTTEPAPSDHQPLVDLFARQNQILAQTSEIIATQNRLLLGEGVANTTATPLADLETKLATVMQEHEVPEVAPIVQEPELNILEPTEDIKIIEHQVFDIVAKVSAFPRSGLRGDLRLVDELGFDSLMVADLSAELQGAYPKIPQLPPALFDLKTTVGDLTVHVETTLNGPATAPEPAVAAGPIARYRVVPAQCPRGDYRAHSVQGETWLVTEDGGPITAQISANLAGLGARVIRVQFSSTLSKAPTQLGHVAINSWPLSDIESLPAALGQSGISLDGFIHGASLSLSDAKDFVNPIDLLHPLAKQLSPKLFMTITGLGGQMGLTKSAALLSSVLQAPLSGYSKALARERPRDRVRCLDIDTRAPATETAQWLVDEILGGDHSPEVGYDGQRWLPELVQAPSVQEQRKLGNEDVILITGGAGEIGRQVATWAAQQGAKAVLLVGRRALSPQISTQLDTLRSLGCTAEYISTDICDKAAFRAAVWPVAESVGGVTVIIHAAGIIEDGVATDKSLESVHRVMDVKVLGVQNLLRSFRGLRDVVLFSSWAGRFGNAGQTDYAAANDLLDRIAVAGVGNTRVVSVVFPPWSSTKMVSTIPESLQKMMRAQGVTFIDDDEGLSTLEAIFNEGVQGIEVVGRDMPARTVQAEHAERLSLTAHPYLDDHRLQGRAVLPLASATDLAAWCFRESTGRVGPLLMKNLELVRGLSEGDRGQVQVRGQRELNGVTKAEVQISSATESTQAGLLAYKVSASNSQVELGSAPVLGGPSYTPKLDLDTFYREKTFHGPQLAGIEAIDRMSDEGIEGRVKCASISAWQPDSQRTQWTVDPLVLDASFQLAGFWLFEKVGRAGFPVGFDSFVLSKPFGPETVQCRVMLRDISKTEFGGDIYYFDSSGAQVGCLRGIRGRFADLEVDTKPEEVKLDISDVPDEAWQIAKFEEVEELDQRFKMAEAMGIKNPYFNLHTGTARDTSEVDGVEMLNFSSYNYLGFSGHPEVVEAAQQAISDYGTSVSASRVASGERPVHRDLEAGLAAHVGVQDALVFVSGHATNVTTVGHMLDKGDLVLHDSLIHDSIMQGILLSGAARRPFPHNDLDALEKALIQIRPNYRRVLICAEGIYSMDGDICDLPRLIELKKRFKTLLMVDEAHSSGVLGHAGKGIADYAGVDANDVDIWMGTLSKSFASCGGFIAGTKDLIRYLKYTAPGFVYSAGIPPANAGAALKSLELMHAQPEVVQQCRDRSKFFLDQARAKGIDTGDAIGAAVVPAIIGNSMECMQLAEKLGERAINVQPIVYPAVEDEKARLRFFISATHSEEQLTHAVDVLVEELTKIRGGSL